MGKKQWIGVTVAVSALAVGAAGGKALADLPPIKGSDTLLLVTRLVTMDQVNYVGGSSGEGETAMALSPPTQKVAPMSRFIRGTGATCAYGSTAAGVVIGLDGVSLMSSATTGGSACGGALAKDTVTFTVSGSCPGCDPGTSTYTIGAASTGGFPGWKDVLKLIYTGFDHTSSTTPDCNSPTRNALVKAYGKLFQTGCTSGTCSQGLRHAFRPTDTSGTTDVFLRMLGAPLQPLAGPQVAGGPPAKNWFCNAAPLANVAPPPFRNPGTGTLNDGTNSVGLSFGGASDYLDGDPIRIPCDTQFSIDDGDLVSGDDICNYGGVGSVGTPGTLGLVQVINVPTNLSPDHLYSIACSPGKFALAPPRLLSPGPLPNYQTPCPGGATSCPCPNGGKLVGTSCWQPYFDLGGGARSFNCINEQQYVQGPAKSGMTDGRSYNLYVKDTNGTYMLDGFTVPEDPSSFASGDDTDVTQRYVTGAFFRIHMDRVSTGSAGAICRKDDSTRQIGCLAQADPCSLGYAGREAFVVNPGVVALSLNGIANTAASIAKVLGPSDPGMYPLARKLYIASLQGFQNLSDSEFFLASHFAFSGSGSAGTGANGAMKAEGFIPLDDPAVLPYHPTGKVFCEDFDEVASCVNLAVPPFTSNTDACLSLPAGLIF